MLKIAKILNIIKSGLFGIGIMLLALFIQDMWLYPFKLLLAILGIS